MVPIGVRSSLGAHDVRTVYQKGWAGLSNGDLLDQAAKAGIDVFVTCDQNIPFQQNLTMPPIDGRRSGQRLPPSRRQSRTHILAPARL